MCEARLLFEHRKAWGDRTNASVPAGTFVPRWSAGTRLILLCRLISGLL